MLHALLVLQLWTAAAADPAADAQLTQRVLPALDARAASARARIDAAEDWFLGRTPLAAAFPDLAHAPLGDPTFLRARRTALAAATAARATERTTAGSPDTSDAAQRAWRQRVLAVCDLEDRADGLELRFLDALAALVERAPGLTDAALAEQLAALATRRARHAAALASGTAPPADIDDVAAAGAAEAAWHTLTDAARRAVSIPDDPTLPALIADLLAAEPAPGLASDQARAQLGAALPLLSAQLAADARARLDAWETLALEAELAAPPASPTVEADATQASLIARRDALRAAAVPPTPAPADASALDQLRARVAARRATDAAAALVVVERALADADPTHGDAPLLSTADEAHERAAEARRLADAQVGEIERALQSRIASLRETLAEVTASEEARRRQVQEDRTALVEELAAQDGALSGALALPPLAAERQETIDRVYTTAWTLIDRVRAVEARVEADRRALLDEQSRKRVGARTDTLTASSEALSGLVAEVDRSGAELDTTLAARVASVQRDQQAFARLLQDAKALRRKARAEASTDAVRVIERRFVEDLRRELADVPMRVRLYLTDVQAEIRAVPGAASDLSKLSSFVRASAGLILLFAAWWGLRARATVLGRALTDQLDPTREPPPGWLQRLDLLRDQLIPGPTRASDTRGADVVRALGNLALAVLLPALAPDSAVTAVLGRVLIAWAALRLVRPVVHLLAVQDDEPGPALVRLAEAHRTRVVASLRLVLTWWFTWDVLAATAVSVLDADRIGDLVRFLRLGTGALVATWTLHRWSDAIHAALAREAPSEGLPRWASAGHAGPLRLVAAGVGATWLCSRFVQDTVVPTLSDSDWFRWIDSAWASRHTAPRRSDVVPLPAEVRASLDQPSAPPSVLDALAFVRDAGTRHASGTPDVCVLTSHGTRERQDLFDRAHAALTPAARRLAVPRLRDAEAARAWCAALAGSPTADLDAIVTALHARERTTFLVDDTERAVLRTVGGYDAIGVLLQVAHLTSSRHLWVFGLHRPTWDFLRAVPSAVDLHVVTRSHHLPRTQGRDLAAWLGAEVARVGCSMHTDACADVRADQSDRERARRVRKSDRHLWRTLETESDGDPFVAHDLWRARLGGDVEHATHILVHPAAAPPTTDTRGFDDPTLFVLQALALHETLDAPDLARTLQLDPTLIQTLCRTLVDGGTLEDTPTGFALSRTWRAAVYARLRQRHLFHL